MYSSIKDTLIVLTISFLLFFLILFGILVGISQYAKGAVEEITYGLAKEVFINSTEDSSVRKVIVSTGNTRVTINSNTIMKDDSVRITTYINPKSGDKYWFKPSKYDAIINTGN
jgi:hypothetical protein